MHKGFQIKRFEEERPCGFVPLAGLIEGGASTRRQTACRDRQIVRLQRQSILGTNSCSLRAAVQRGYVGAVSQSVSGKILTVSEADVADFMERYVFTPKLASELGKLSLISGAGSQLE